MAWALARVKDQIDNEFGVGQTKITLNVGAPIIHYKDSPPLRYLRIVQAAWEAVFGDDPYRVENGASWEDVSARFLHWLDLKDVPGRDIRRFDVLPETIAPIVSLSQEPSTADGMYLIFDMGAGTTEISINRVGTPVTGQKIVCYADQSIVLGGDDFERADGKSDGLRKQESWN
jgi:hypothetical protein